MIWSAAACFLSDFPNAASADAIEPSVTDIFSQDRKVRSLAKNVFGSTRETLPGGSYGKQQEHGASRDAITTCPVSRRV